MGAFCLYSATHQYLNKFSNVVWSEPKISQIEAWNLAIYAWYQAFKYKNYLYIFFIFQSGKKKFLELFLKKQLKFLILNIKNKST
jgi:short-subunit dehydrogenase